MEELKKLNEINQSDIRHIVLFRTLENAHRFAGSVSLHDGVPEDIRDIFHTAQHLIIYSWHYYPFNIASVLIAATCVEKALKHKFKPKSHEAGFRHMIRKSIREGLIKADGFYYYTSPASEGAVKISEKEYLDNICKTIPELRDAMAHGDSLLHNKGPQWVMICSDFINQLFQKIE